MIYPKSLHQLLIDKFQSAKIIIAGRTTRYSLDLVRELRQFGCSDFLVVLNKDITFKKFLEGRVPSIGAGKSSNESITASINSYQKHLVVLHDDVRRAINRFDPAGDAIVIIHPTIALDELAGRTVFGYKNNTYNDLQNKLKFSVMLDKIDVLSSEYIVCPSNSEEIRSGFMKLNRGKGVVIAADNKLGWHGAGDRTRWIHHKSDCENIASFFRDRANEVRIMPFLTGVPCSAQLLITNESCSVLNIVEQLNLLNIKQNKFVFCGVSSYWRPNEKSAGQIVKMGESIGEILRVEDGYRGFLSIDGILTEDGFMPTEINPRFSYSFMCQDFQIRTAAMYIHHLALSEWNSCSLIEENCLVRLTTLFQENRYFDLSCWSENTDIGQSSYSMKMSAIDSKIESDELDIKLQFSASPLGTKISCTPSQTAISHYQTGSELAKAILGHCDNNFRTSIGKLTLPF